MSEKKESKREQKEKSKPTIAEVDHSASFKLKCIISTEIIKDHNIGIAKLKKSQISFRKVKFLFERPLKGREKKKKICPSCNRKIVFNVTSIEKETRDKKIGKLFLIIGLLSIVLMNIEIQIDFVILILSAIIGIILGTIIWLRAWVYGSVGISSFEGGNHKVDYDDE